MAYLDSSVVLPVSDLRRAIGFYTEDLGLSLRLLVGRSFAEVRAPGLTIGLRQAGTLASTAAAPAGAPIALAVDDLAGATARLRARGIRVAAALATPAGLEAWFHDPDGNPLCLREPLGYGVSSPAPPAESAGCRTASL